MQNPSNKLIFDTFKSPNFIPSSRTGLIYQLSPYYFKLLNIQSVSLSLGDFYDMKKIIKNFPPDFTFKKYIGVPSKTLTYLSPIDYYKPICIEGLSDPSKVKLTTHSGVHKVSYSEINEFITDMKCDI